ncbi:tetratricopeptide repeat protein [Flavobacterium sp. MAH-1]|uniref:Tetratricopeptide repeat protein n=1 Tax=Flavobacterium agri TaxID=2743471 RepID=A0A7Y9C5Z0_9FLAO|nr:tetratricopeptide repeat protein [Flavobacterium agri]NUY81451.1 tetratricopeptide repeat protein [Flavobacterium agri]NYA71475.1 tetratricopeptide repeat protein [Flavobacterium agri]
MDANYHDQYDKNYLHLNDMMGELALKNYQKKTGAKLHKIYAEWLGAYYSAVAADYSHQEKNDESLRYHNLAIETLRAVKSYDDMYAANLNKAQLYTLIKEEDKAIPLIFASLKYYEKNPQRNLQQLSFALSMMSHVYREQKKWETSIQYCAQAVKYYDLSYAQNPNNRTLSLKATCYSNMANAYSKLQRYDETLRYCDKALEIARKIKSNGQIAQILSRIADTKMKLSKFEEAEQTYQQVLDMKNLQPNSIPVALCNFGMGILNFKKGNPDKAQPFAEKAMEISKTTANVTLQKDIATLLYDIYVAKKEHEKALAIYRFHEKISDSSQIQSSRNELAQQILKYDFEKKELQQKIVQDKKVSDLKLEAQRKSALQNSKNKLARQQLVYDFEKKQLNEKLIQGKKLTTLRLEAEKKTAEKNNLLLGLSALLVLFASGGYFYYRHNRQKQAITVLEKNQIKQKLLITQMNPHFIFNSVQNITSLINNKQNNEAVDYLGKFSKLTRQILENSNENYISLEEEVEMIENYLSIQQLLYEDKFTYTVIVEENIDVESMFLPPMLAQPFIENAIKHGLSNTLENGKIAVHFYLDDNKLFFEVTDNGKGFDTEKKVSNHKSLAMTITKERLVNYTKNKNFVVQTDNLLNPEGTIRGAKVVFEVPYIYEN